MDDFTSGEIAAAASSTPSATASSSADVSPASAPDTTAQPAAATVQPASSAVPASTTPVPTGEPPQERWKDILDNTRTKTRAEVEKEWEAYAWAKQVPPDQIHTLISMAPRLSRLGTDPIGFVNDLIAELSQHPEHAPRLRSEAGRLLARARGPAVDLEPDVVVMGDNGQIATKTYSADKMRTIVKHAVAEAIGKEVQPLKQAHQEQQATKVAEARHAAVAKAADDMLASASKWHGYKEHIGSIAQALNANPRWSLQDAYLDVLHREILPGLSKTERAKVIADINQTPAASTPSPSGSTTSAPKPDAEKSWEELFKEKASAAGLVAR